MINSVNIRILTLTLVFLISPATASAQSVTILGNSTDAKECFFSAGLAVQMESTSRSELQTCNKALKNPNLGIRDKAATYVNRGILYVALEDYQMAIKDYANAMKLYPKFGAIYVNRGNLFFIGKSYDL